MDASIYHSKLDTDRFGFKIARINCFEGDVSELVASLGNSGYKLIISKVNTDHVRLINKLEDTGFRLKDTQVTYKYELPDCPPPLTIPSNITIRSAELADRSALYEIAIRSFANYGHYSTNEKLDQSKVKEVYGDWTLRSFDRQIADSILVAEVGEQIAGFLTHKIHKDERKWAVGGIGAVDQDFRNRDIFRAIVLSGIDWARENSCLWVEHNVLVTNYAVSRSFIKIGFKPAASVVTLHKWL